MDYEKVQEAFSELRQETNKIVDYDSLVNWKNKATNLMVRIYGKDSTQVEQIAFLRHYSASSVPGNRKQAEALMEGLIKEVERFGVPENIEKNENKGLHINITQNQNQQTKISLNLLIESIQDELRGGELKELQTIIDDNEIEPTEKKNKIVETLKKFGTDVASNIVANILTNPTLFG